MKQTAIWKYILNPRSRHEHPAPTDPSAPMLSCKFEIPIRHTVLSTHEQDGHPTVWILVDTNMPTMEDVVFDVYVTGHTCDVTHKQFIGTCLLHHGIVVHVWKRLG